MRQVRWRGKRKGKTRKEVDKKDEEKRRRSAAVK